MRLVLLAAIMAAFLIPAQAHDAPMGWAYDMECCHNQDCAPLPEDQTPKPIDGGDWLLKTGEVVPKSKVKFSPDGKYHLCRWHANGVILCLYVPPSST